MRIRIILKACCPLEQDAEISVGVCRGRKSTKEKWPLEVRSKRPTGQIAEPLDVFWWLGGA